MINNIEKNCNQFYTKTGLIKEFGGAEMRTGTLTVLEPNLVFLNQGIQTENKLC
jgi:hypothetical protein